MEIPVSYANSSFFVSDQQPDDKVYREIVSQLPEPQTDRYNQYKIPPLLPTIQKGKRFLQEMLWVDSRSGRVSTTSFNVYIYAHQDELGRLHFLWHGMFSLWHCSWTLYNKLMDIADRYDRMFVLVDDCLVKLPFGQPEFGISKVCDFCPNQFACLAGQEPSCLVGDDLLPSKPNGLGSELFKDSFDA